MGRPLNKDINGVKVIGTFTGDAGIKVTGKFGGTTNSDYYLVKQRGAKTYVVTRDGTTFQLGVLASSIVNNGDILITGSVTGLSPANIAIAKLTKRLATDFSSNTYTWYLKNYQDSTGDLIVLTPTT
jgi:restriction endonuclease S subunit